MCFSFHRVARVSCPLVHWSIGPLVSWSLGPLVPLVHCSSGPLVKCKMSYVLQPQNQNHSYFWFYEKESQKAAGWANVVLGFGRAAPPISNHCQKLAAQCRLLLIFSSRFVFTFQTRCFSFLFSFLGLHHRPPSHGRVNNAVEWNGLNIGIQGTAFQCTFPLSLSIPYFFVHPLFARHTVTVCKKENPNFNVKPIILNAK